VIYKKEPHVVSPDKI